MEEWYTEEIALSTEDPNIIRKILEKGNNDKVSRNAVKNKNCPIDALKMVLERGSDDEVSWIASEHFKCPSDVLKMVLEKGNDDYVSRNAALNINCPPDVLKIVLEKGNNDYVSRNSAYNKNCPLDAVIKWKMLIGRIQIESKEHKIQYVNKPKDDSDLKKLQALILD